MLAVPGEIAKSMGEAFRLCYIRAKMDTDASSSSVGAVVTVRGLAPELKARLRIRAAHNARSMEAEARAILETALSLPEEDTTDLAAFARNLFTPLGGVELELPARAPLRDPPAFALPDDAADPLLSLTLKPSDAASGQDKQKPTSATPDAPTKARRRRL